MRTMPRSFSSKRLSIVFLVLVLILDQLSKWGVFFYLNESIKVTSFFNIVFVQNKGVTFGFLKETASPFFLISIAVFAIVSLILFVKNRASYYRLPTALIIGGAIGNIIDRIVHGAVIDFLDFHLYQYHWPAFNVADSAVVLGVTFIIIALYLEDLNLDDMKENKS